jgi:hypothetical protein
MSRRDKMLVERNIIAFYRFARSSDGFPYQQRQPAQYADRCYLFYRYSVLDRTDKQKRRNPKSRNRVGKI